MGRKQLPDGQTEKEGFASMITVINGGDALTEPARAELLEVRSHTRQVKLADDEAQAVKLRQGDRSYVVILCHNRGFPWFGCRHCR